MLNKNKLKCLFFTLCLVFFLSGIGYAVASQRGALAFFTVSVLSFCLLWFRSDELILRLFRAMPADESNRAVMSLLIEISLKSYMPVPDLYFTPDLSANGFSLGHSVHTGKIILTKGILSTLDEKELEAVLACELQKIREGYSFVASYAGAVQFILNSPAVLLKWLSYFLSGNEFRTEKLNTKKSIFRPSSVLSFIANTHSLFMLPWMWMMNSVLSNRESLERTSEKIRVTCDDPDALERAIHKIRSRDFFNPMEVLPGLNQIYFEVNGSRFGFYDF